MIRHDIQIPAECGVKEKIITCRSSFPKSFLKLKPVILIFFETIKTGTL